MRALVLLVALAGCQRTSDEPSCRVVMDHLATIMKNEVMKQDLSVCEGRKLTGAQRRCLVAAKSLDDIASCKAGLPK